MAQTATPSILERGVLLLDKPETLESMRCVEKAKAMLKARKAGHSGTLDPKVTGLMLIAFNEATKAMPLMIGMRKRYTGIMAVHEDVELPRIEAAAAAFTGKITQTPPRKSAVVRKPREREVFYFKVTGMEGRNVSFETDTEAGTYIRKLCHDMGEHLGIGAHMKLLRRTSIGPFDIKEAHTLEDLREKGQSLLFPVEDALRRMDSPRLFVKQEAVQPIRNGSPLHQDFLSGPAPPLLEGQRACILSGTTLVGIAIMKEGVLKTDRIFNLP